TPLCLSTTPPPPSPPYPLSLHDALPIYLVFYINRFQRHRIRMRHGCKRQHQHSREQQGTKWPAITRPFGQSPPPRLQGVSFMARSEEHTSELQSRFDLVCRLLLEKKKKH